MDTFEWIVEFEHKNGKLVTVRYTQEYVARMVYERAVAGPNECSIRLYRVIRISVAEKLFICPQKTEINTESEDAQNPMECEWCGDMFATDSYDLTDGRVFCSEMCRAQGEAGRRM